MSPAEPIRILCVDDHPLVRKGIASILANEADMRLVAEAGGGKEAVELFRQHHPDVTLMDLRMPGVDGIEATRIIRQESPDAKITNTEYMFPYVTVVQCPQEQMIEKIGPTLVATAITNDKKWERQLTDATNIDRLNIGPIPTTKLDWLQPHEGNIVDFLFRARAFQIPNDRLTATA